MASNFPTGLDTNPGNPTSNETLQTGGHANLHTWAQNAVVAIETYIGIVGSAVTTTLTYLLTNTASIDPGHKHTTASGGTGLYVTPTKGDLLIGTGSGWAKLSVGSNGQILTANSLATNGADWESSPIPSGTLVDYAGSSAPTGWLLADGSAVSRTTYAALFAVLGTTWGAGDGSTTFNVPDTRSRVSIGKGTGTKVATISANASNTFTVTGLTNANNNEFQTGEAIVFSATVAGNLTNGATYYVIRVANNQFKVASSLANAQNGTAITLAGTETGSFTLTLSTRTLADTGGEEKHAMSLTELLDHVHTGAVGSGTGGSGNQVGASNTINTGDTGGNSAMNVMNPFYVVTKIIKI